MRRLYVGLAALLLLSGLLVAYAMTSLPQRADAAGCGPEQFTSSTTAWVGGDNLKIAGRPLKWTFGVTSRDCDGYDIVSASVGANLSKSNIGCEAFGGKTDGYKFNPNSLGNVNPGEKWVDCIGSAGNYGVTFPVLDGVVIRSSMPADERCLNFTFTVDVIAQADPDFTNADPICFNGL